MKHMEKDLEIKIKIKGKVRNFNLAEELKITEEELNEQMMTQPAKYAWVAVLSNLASSSLETLRTQKKALHAELDKKHRQLREEEELKVTEKIIDADIEGDSNYKRMNDQIIEASLNAGLMQTAVASFSQRKDMLIGVASNLRAQGDSKLSILKDKAKETIKKKKGKS